MDRLVYARRRPPDGTGCSVMMLLHRNGCILSCTCEVYVTRTCAEARHVKWISTCSNLRHMKRRVKLGRLFALFLIIALIRLLFMKTLHKF